MFGRTRVTAGLFLLMTATCLLSYAQPEELPLPVVPAVPASAPADPPPSAIEPLARDRTHGLVLVPCLGMNVPLGKLTDGYTQGFHLGVLAGWHLTPRLSLNGGLALDLMNSTFDSSIFEPHEYYLDASLTPFVHFQDGAIFIGPQVGWFVNSRSRSDADERSNLFSGGQRSPLPGSASSGPSAPTLVKHSGQGILLGVTAGAFTPVGKLALGLVVAGVYRRFITADCQGSACADRLGSVARLDVSFAALY